MIYDFTSGSRDADFIRRELLKKYKQASQEQGITDEFIKEAVSFIQNGGKPSAKKSIDNRENPK
jgi:hypothetical protein